jgi:hypothetical protein
MFSSDPCAAAQAGSGANAQGERYRPEEEKSGPGTRSGDSDATDDTDETEQERPAAAEDQGRWIEHSLAASTSASAWDGRPAAVITPRSFVRFLVQRPRQVARAILKGPAAAEDPGAESGPVMGRPFRGSLPLLGRVLRGLPVVR